MKKSIVTLFVLLAVTLAFGIVYAQEGDRSAKVSTATSNLALLGTEEGVWTTILSSNIKTSASTSLVTDVSLECGLYTRTNVKSQKGNKDQVAAEASVRVKVLLDGNTLAIPGDVVFCKRSQELTATFAGILESCWDQDGDGVVTIPDECTFLDEELQLILDTVSANSFNFVIPDVGSGTHTVEVQAIIDTCTGTLVEDTVTNIVSCVGGDVDATARGTIGKGSLIVDEVRYATDEIYGPTP